MAARFLPLLLGAILFAAPAFPFVRPAPPPRTGPQMLSPGNVRRLLRMQKRNREMDRIMAKRARSG
ncbi:MAG TPA: hypothetical protein VKV74_08025 [Bryobacteraceae bacterium]|nr:hypothetical protein [Bryobacteraceae bacterium]